MPLTLITLRFGRDYNQPLTPSVLPGSLQKLTFGERFNQILAPGSLPHSIKFLVFGEHFTREFKAGALPTSLYFLRLNRRQEFKNIRVTKGTYSTIILDHMVEADESGGEFKSIKVSNISSRHCLCIVQHEAFSPAANQVLVLKPEGFELLKDDRCTLTVFERCSNGDYKQIVGNVNLQQGSRFKIIQYQLIHGGDKVYGATVTRQQASSPESPRPQGFNTVHINNQRYYVVKKYTESDPSSSTPVNTSGQTYLLMKDDDTKVLILCREINYSNTSSKRYKRIMSEIKVMDCLKGQGEFVDFYTYYDNKDTQTIQILEEYCDGGSLQDKIDQIERLNRREDIPHYIKEGEIWTYLTTMLNMLRIMEQNGIAHRDIKPSNLYIKGDLGIKLGGFGLATIVTRKI
ncbi:hypothetical protein SAMD00019534_110900 [Acytostelium subglobosum LB1]|uniref:hypothetical protein n=1 Tax=Acytostelium subglobosum LB1 TaxID=1410327 RepID=UPI00064489B1|nr:hypothetical protein SAMD00019534_110900 [Acytostelium subglobosum LB1]GAM27914.1 hypothetical protein SAMD00019534_110900 [Acytostelium subglobosum LB1]|eukprot:XP_012749197.1 hypothetical protein SAMD00019534_110900 [Acytostelium subglobosum LB1]